MRNYKIDFIKSVAIIFVIAIHVLASALYEYPIGSKSFLVIVIYRSFVGSAVPLFFMCSGVLLFDKNKIISTKDIIKKYIPRVLIALFFWASIYEIIQIYYRYKVAGVFEKSSLILAFQNMIFFNHNYQLYYIYIMILFYLLTPVIKSYISSSKTEDIKFFLIVWVCLGIVLPNFLGFEFVRNFSNFTQYVSMSMGYASLGYGVLGYHIYNNTKKTSTYLTAFLVGLISATVLTLWLCNIKGDIDITFWGGMSVPVMLMSYGIFGFVLSTNFSLYKTKIITSISNASFAIFLVHDIFLKALSAFDIKVSSLPRIINVPIIVFAIFICSYVSYLLLSKIKIVKKYLI